MHSAIVFICLVLAYDVYSQDCGCFPSNLPLPLKHLLAPISTFPVPPPCGYKPCGCPDPSCVCGSVIQAPTVPPCGCYNSAIGLPNPVFGVQTCGCPSPYGCTCGTPAVGNLCGRSTPTVGLATTCGCSDPAVRIVDGCPRCQPVYSYNLPSIGYPAGCTGYGGVIAPSYLPPCGCTGYDCGCNPIVPYRVPCGCAQPCGCCNVCGCNPCVCNPCGCGVTPCSCGVTPCSCGATPCSCGVTPCSCGVTPCSCGGTPCGCGVTPCSCGGNPCSCGINPCGCVEVPCGLPKVKTTCTCVTPTIETPYGSAQGKPTCACATTFEMPTCGVPVVPPFPPVVGCSRYLRQVCVQPPYL